MKDEDLISHCSFDVRRVLMNLLDIIFDQTSDRNHKNLDDDDGATTHKLLIRTRVKAPAAAAKTRE